MGDVHAIMRFLFDSRFRGASMELSRLPARHREASAEADGPLRRGGRGKPLPQFLIMVWSNGVVKSPQPPFRKGGQWRNYALSLVP